MCFYTYICFVPKEFSVYQSYSGAFSKGFGCRSKIAVGKHLHRHLPYRSRRFVIEADHAAAAKCLYLAFVDEGSVRDVHAVGHHPCTLMREIFVVLYCIGLDCSVFVGQSDPHGNHGTVLIMLAYHIYKLLVVTFSHDVPLYTVFSHSLAGIYCRTFVRLCKEGYIRAKSQPLP